SWSTRCSVVPSVTILSCPTRLLVPAGAHPATPFPRTARSTHRARLPIPPTRRPNRPGSKVPNRADQRPDAPIRDPTSPTIRRVRARLRAPGGPAELPAPARLAAALTVLLVLPGCGAGAAAP